MTKSTSYQKTVAKIADLAELEIKKQEVAGFAEALADALDVVDELGQIDVKGVEPTARVSQGVNRWREDEIDTARMFTQEQALANATQTYQGYFMVGRLIDHEG